MDFVSFVRGPGAWAIEFGEGGFKHILPNLGGGLRSWQNFFVHFGLKKLLVAYMLDGPSTCPKIEGFGAF